MFLAGSSLRSLRRFSLLFLGRFLFSLYLLSHRFGPVQFSIPHFVQNGESLERSWIDSLAPARQSDEERELTGGDVDVEYVGVRDSAENVGRIVRLSASRACSASSLEPRCTVKGDIRRAQREIVTQRNPFESVLGVHSASNP